MSEKTEQPTSKRLRDSRKKGDVAYSKDFTQTFLILAIFGYLLASAGHIVETLGQMILLPGTLLRLGFNEAANTLVQELLKEAAWIVLPFIGIVLGVARVMGETAPLIILLNYGPRLSLDPTSQNMGSLPTMIMTASEVAESYPGAERGWGAAMTLILIVMGLNLAAKFAGSTKKSR